MKRARKDAPDLALKQRRLPLHPALDLPLNQEEQEPPFLRSKTRTRVRRARRGPLGRAILAAQAAALLLLAGLVGWAGYSRVMASERLKVGRVEIRGSRFLAEQEVRDLLGTAVGGNILGLDIEALKARLRTSPWVADAAIGRALPDTLRVEIRERAPLALAEADQLQLMDEDGTLIEPYGPRTAAFDLPIVRGLRGASSEVVRDRAQRAGGLLRDLGELSAEISEVDVKDAADLRVVLRGEGEVLRMGGPPYRKKLMTYLELRQDLARRCPDAEYFDLRFRDRIFVKETLPPPPPKAPVTSTQTMPQVAEPPAPLPQVDTPLPPPESDAQGDATPEADQPEQGVQGDAAQQISPSGERSAIHSRGVSGGSGGRDAAPPSSMTEVGPG